jgi:thiamine kinase-like enzyme
VDVPEAWFHWFDYEVYLSELHGFMDEYGSWLATTGEDGQALSQRLGRLVAACTNALRETTVRPARGHFPLCLCRVDPNLQNAIWCVDGHLRWVDWEYSGWGDPALDLAELRWHAGLMDLEDNQHAWLRDSYPRRQDDPHFDARLAVWDHLLAARWPFLTLRALWSCYNGPHRLRLSSPGFDSRELHQRTVSLIERAEAYLL